MDNYSYTRDQEIKSKSLCKRIVHCAFKEPVVLWRENCLSKQLRFLERSKRNLSLLAGKCFLCISTALLKGLKIFSKKKKTKSFGGKIVLRKKGCALERSLALSEKYTKSFGGKSLALCNDFNPSKVVVYLLFQARLFSKAQNFFLFGNPPLAKKSKRDSLHFD